MRCGIVLLLLGGGVEAVRPAGEQQAAVGFLSLAQAQDEDSFPANSRSEDGFHRVYVPTELIEQVLRPGWVPVSRGKLETLLKAARTAEQRPDPAVLTSARWTATLADDLLAGGRFQGEVAIADLPSARAGESTAEQPRLIVLPESNLAWKSLLLDGQPAVWGTLNDGRTVVALPSGRRTVQLAGTWEYRGRKLARSLECRLALWPALSSTVELVLAAGLTVESNAGETEGPLSAKHFRPAFSGPEPDARSKESQQSTGRTETEPSGLADAPPQGNGPLAVWRLAAGSLSELKVSVLEPLPRSTPPMVIFSRSDLTCVVREAGVEVSADFNLEVLDGQTDQLLFQLPEDFQVHSVQLAGAVASWSVQEEDGRRELAVSLPVAIRGPGRPVQVRGEVPLKLGGGWELPVLQLLNSVFVERQIHLQVTPPLELHGHVEVDTRQTEAVTSSDGGTILSFRQTSAAARLTADIGYPRQVVGVQSLSVLTFGERQWQNQSEFVWQVQSGTAWQVQCTVPAGWRITEVQGWNRWPEGDSAGETALSSWSTRPNPDGSQLLLMEFLEALTPSRAGLVRIRALRTTASGPLTDRLPIIQPIGAGTIATAVAVEQEASRHFELTRPGPFLRVDVSRLPAITRTLPLWQQIRQPGVSRQLFVSNTPDASGRLRISSVRPLYSSRVLVTVDVGRHSIRQKWQISLDDAESSGGQIHVWLPGRLPDLVWTLSDDPSTVLPCHVLDPEDFPEWMLDASGTLLAIETGGRPAAELTVEAERTFPFSLPWEPALAFVPGSSRFEAEVELRLRGTACAIETRGMDQVASRVEQPADPERPAAGLRRNVTGSQSAENAAPGQHLPADGSFGTAESPSLHSVDRWEYHSIADSLTLTPESARQAATAVTGARLELHSEFRTQGGTAQHRAVFHIPAGENTGAFIVQQPDAAGPVLCFLDGRPISAGTEEPAIHRLPLSVDQPHEVELRYSTPLVAGQLSPSLSIPLPQTPHPVAGFRWQIRRDVALQLLTAPAGLVTSVPPEKISWFSRLFGPVGRSLDRRLFNPFVKADWQDLWSPRSGDSAAAVEEANLLSAAGPLPGSSLSIRFWNADVASRRAWVCLLLALLIGWLLRHRQVDFRGRAGAAVLGICLAGCCFLSPPGALICGGIVSGLLLAACLPRRLVHGGTRDRWSPDEADQVPVGSTATYRMGASFLLLLAFVLQWLQPAVAQNGVPRPQPRSANGEQPKAASAEGRNDLIIPVDKNQQPSTEMPVAWLHYSRLAGLQQAAAVRQQPEFGRVLIHSLRWTGQLPESGAADLTATCEVIVLPGAAPAVLSLPFQGGNLAGPQPCLVDGQPREVTRDPATGSLQIQLTEAGSPAAESTGTAGASSAAAPPAVVEDVAISPSPEQPEPAVESRLGRRLPVVAPVPGITTLPAVTDGTTRHVVVLQLRVPVDAKQADRSFTIHCPPANSAELELQLFAGCGQARIEQAQGGAFCDAQAGVLRAELGACSEFTVSAATGESVPGRAIEPPKMTADVATLIDVTPNQLNHQTQIRFTAEQEPMDFVRLRLPPGAILRNAATEQPHRATVLPSSADGSREILIELTEAASQEVTARLSFVVPRVRNSSEIDVPVPDLLPRTGGDGFRLIRRSSLAAVSHPLEMHLQHTKAREPACVPVPVQEFLTAWGDDSLPRRPRFAFRIDGPAAIRLQQLQVAARREAKILQTVLVTRHRLEVLLEATLSTYDAPAFDHVLLTDSRLRISSVSVTEDQANRLQRWSHADGRLVLYLSGRTTGTQQIQIRGSLPLEGTGDTSLPQTVLEDGRITHAELNLYRSRDVEVRPGWTGGLPPSEPTGAGSEGEGNAGSGGAAIQNAGRRELVRDAVPLSHVTAEGELPELELLSVIPVTEPLVAESVLIVGREGRKGMLPVEIRLRLSGGVRQLPVLQLRIPAAPDEAFRLVESGRLRAFRSELRPDGSQMLSFDTSEIQSSVTLVFRTSVLARNGLQLPLPAVDGAVQLPAIALLGQELVPEKTVPASADAGTEEPDNRRPDSQVPPVETSPPARPLDMEQVPNWIAESGVPPFVTSWQLARKPEQPLVWQLTAPAQQGPRAPRIRLLLTTLWLNENSSLSGTTEMILDPGDAAGLTLEWPEGTVPGSAVIGQTPVQPVFNSHREVELTVPANGAPALVQITWERNGTGGMSPFSGRQVPLPAVKNADVLRELVLISSPAETSMTISSTGLRGNVDDVATLVIAALLEALQSAANDGFVEGDLHQLLSAAVGSETAGINHSSRKPANGDESSRLPRLIDQAEEKLERLSNTLPAAGHSSSPNGLASVFTLLNRPEDAPGFVVVLPPEDPRHRPVSHTIGIQLLGTAPLRWLAGLMLALALAIVLPGIPQRHWGDWLSQNQLMVLALAGTAWWAMLAAGGAGFLLLLLAGGIAVRRALLARFRPPETELRI